MRPRLIINSQPVASGVFHIHGKESAQAIPKIRLVANIWVRVDSLRLTSRMRIVLHAQQKPAATHMAAGSRFGVWVGLVATVTPTKPIAQAAQFIMNGANHPIGGFSTFPFQMFGLGDPDSLKRPGPNNRGDLVVGNDVWIGREAVIMPGVRIGDGAIIGTRAQVTRNVPAYAVVAGNPSRVVKMRFPPEIVAELLAIRWWDWEADRIARHVDTIQGADIDALRTAV